MSNNFPKIIKNHLPESSKSNGSYLTSCGTIYLFFGRPIFIKFDYRECNFATIRGYAILRGAQARGVRGGGSPPGIIAILRFAILLLNHCMYTPPYGDKSEGICLQISEISKTYFFKNSFQNRSHSDGIYTSMGQNLEENIA